MPNSTSNIIVYFTIAGRYPVVNIPTATASAITQLATAASTASVISDVIFRTSDATARTWDIILCATGSQATAENARVQISVPANSGNNGSVAPASLAQLAPQLFAIDSSGNRVIALEAGQSIYVKNNATTAGYNYITANIRDY